MEAEAITLRMPTRSREEATFDEPVEPTIESRDDKPSSNSHTANGYLYLRADTHDRCPRGPCTAWMDQEVDTIVEFWHGDGSCPRGVALEREEDKKHT